MEETSSAKPTAPLLSSTMARTGSGSSFSMGTSGSVPVTAASLGQSPNLSPEMRAQMQALLDAQNQAEAELAVAQGAAHAQQMAALQARQEADARLRAAEAAARARAAAIIEANRQERIARLGMHLTDNKWVIKLDGDGSRAQLCTDHAIMLQKPISDQRLSLDQFTQIFLKEGEEAPLCDTFRFLCSSVSIGPGTKWEWRGPVLSSVPENLKSKWFKFGGLAGRPGEWVEKAVPKKDLGAKYIVFTDRRILVLDASHAIFNSMAPFDAHTVEQRLDAAREKKALQILDVIRPGAEPVQAATNQKEESLYWYAHL